jgi:hypothetical protein
VIRGIDHLKRKQGVAIVAETAAMTGEAGGDVYDSLFGSG